MKSSTYILQSGVCNPIQEKMFLLYQGLHSTDQYTYSFLTVNISICSGVSPELYRPMQAPAVKIQYSIPAFPCDYRKQHQHMNGPINWGALFTHGESVYLVTYSPPFLPQLPTGSYSSFTFIGFSPFELQSLQIQYCILAKICISLASCYENPTTLLYIQTNPTQECCAPLPKPMPQHTSGYC